VILFWMWGGPSQLETYDLKPNAPSEYRGPFRPIKTDVAGVDISELFPRQARLGKKIALVRSLHHTMASHNDGSIAVLTGKTPVKADPTSTALSDHPDFGMVASKMRGIRSDGLPQYVGVPTQPFMTRPAYLGLAHKAFAAGNPAVPTYAPPNLTLAGGLNARGLDDRKALLTQFDRLRRDIDVQAQMEGAEKVRATALDMLSKPGISQAFDLTREPPKLRDRYGRHLWGQSCLLARRLAEAGTAVVTIDALAPEQGKPLYFSWLGSRQGHALAGALPRSGSLGPD
jgi:hypothetical protein